jgi:hypothetical protein
MEASATWLRLTLDAGRDLPMEEFDELVRDLQDELLVLDVLDVELAQRGLHLLGARQATRRQEHS